MINIEGSNGLPTGAYEVPTPPVTTPTDATDRRVSAATSRTPRKGVVSASVDKYSTTETIQAADDFITEYLEVIETSETAQYLSSNAKAGQAWETGAREAVD